MDTADFKRFQRSEKQKFYDLLAKLGTILLDCKTRSKRKESPNVISYS
jgi:hypothetical protein